MFEIIIIVLCIIYLVLNSFALFGILSQVDDDFKTGVLIGIKEFVGELFYNRNIFGIFLSSMFLILVIPTIILALGIQVVVWISMFLGYIYNLGNKKDR